jgi:hypothetical protein
MTTARNRWTLRLAGAATVALLVGALVDSADAGPRNRKLDRQIRIMERVIDDMLVESPNWLVQSSHECRGSYDEGEGAVFTFDADLVHKGHFRSSKWKWWGGDHFFIFGDDDDDEEEDDDDYDRMSRSERREARKKMEQRSLRKQERLYKRGKTEIVEVIMDYGDLLTAVPDGEWIEIEVYLDDADYFYENDLRRLVVKAKMSDVRAFADEKIDEKTMVERVQVEES